MFSSSFVSLQTRSLKPHLFGHYLFRMALYLSSCEPHVGVFLKAVRFDCSGTTLCEALVNEALQKLFLNPHIWLFTPFVVQRALYMSLLNYGETEGSHLHQVCGLSKVLDTLRQFYWDRPKSRRALGTRPLLHPVTKVVIGERPSQSEVAKLRLLVLGLAERALR